MEVIGPKLEEGRLVLYYTNRKLEHAHRDKHPYIGIVSHIDEELIHFNLHAYALHKDSVTINGNLAAKLISPTAFVKPQNIDRLFVGRATVMGYLSHIPDLAHHTFWIRSLKRDGIIPKRSTFLIESSISAYPEPYARLDSLDYAQL